MCFLRLNVSAERRKIGRPNRKRTIAALPRKRLKPRRLRLQPLRRRGLEVFHNLGNRDSPRKPNGGMNMIGNTSNAIAFAADIASAAGKVGIKIVAYRMFQQRFAITGGEDDMHKDERKRLWHVQKFYSGLNP